MIKDQLIIVQFPTATLGDAAAPFGEKSLVRKIGSVGNRPSSGLYYTPGRESMD
jgi:hypothetical protein